MKTFPWLLRRELWEHRSFYIVPLVLITILAVLHLYGTLTQSGVAHMVEGHNVMLGELMLEQPDMAKFVLGTSSLVIPAVLLNAALIATWLFYLTGTLYGDRKDRSVLFWKSLPLSDSQTVLSKLFTAMITLPAITLAAVFLGAILLALSSSVGVMIAGENPWSFVISQVPWLSGPVALGYGFIVQSLWYAPIFGWLLLASAWAPRVPALWAVLPPIVVIIIEELVFNTGRFADFIGPRLIPVVPTAFRHDGDDIHPEDFESLTSFIDVQGFLSDPGLWGGLVVAAVFVAAAIWLRRYRDAF